MAHLSERHESAKRRRDDLLRDRSLALAMRTGYPETFNKASSSKRTMATVVTPSAVEFLEKKEFTEEDLAAARLRCQDRLKSAREKESQERRRQRDLEVLQQARCELSSRGSEIAVQRLRERKEKRRQLEEEEIDLLISQQTSSIQAMNIARMLSPRFEEKVAFAPAVPKYSAEEERVVHLLTNQRVGSFYQ